MHPATAPHECSLSVRAADDIALGRVVLFTFINDGETWTWDGATWSKQPPNRFLCPHYGFSLAYDAATRQIVLFGGTCFPDCDEDFHETWSWNGRAWQLRNDGTALAGPSSPAYTSMMYNSTIGALVVTSGCGIYSIPPDFDETGRWNGRSWLSIATRAPAPPACGNGFVYDDAHHFGVLFARTSNTYLFTAGHAGGGYAATNSRGEVAVSGDAVFAGDASSSHLAQPIVGIAPTPGGHGYWLVSRDGGVFAYGDAPFFGTTLGGSPTIAITGSPTGNGYWLFHADGTVGHYGDAPDHGRLNISGAVSAFAT